MTLKLGRRPARHTQRTMRSALALARALAPLGAPPAASQDYVTPLQQTLARLPTVEEGARSGCS